jgi:predicted dienelactone hydrolase
MNFVPRSRARFWIVALGLTVGMFLQHFLEGAHWQLLPLYLSGLFLWLAAPAAKRWPRKGTIFLSAACLLLVCATAFLSWLMPMFQLPKPSGSYVVGTRIFHLVDQRRNEDNGRSPSGKRELMIQAWYPAQLSPKRSANHLANYQRRAEVTLRASYRSVLKTNSYLDAEVHPGGPYPVLIYNPSWMGERTEGTFQTEELASHGFIVVAVDHTFFGGLIQFPDGRVTDSHTVPQLGNFDHSTAGEQWALGSKFVHIEADDDAFVLDQLTAMNEDQASPWFHKLDLARVGAMGFSIGGATAEQFAWQDPRVKAALNLDGWTLADAGLHGIDRPLMVIYEDKSHALPTDAELHSSSIAERTFWQFSAADYAHVTTGMRKYGGYLLFIAGTHHVDFTDRSLLSPLRRLTGGGELNSTRAHSIINAYTLAFFTHLLEAEPAELLEKKPSPYPEVEIQIFAATKPQGR